MLHAYKEAAAITSALIHTDTTAATRTAVTAATVDRPPLL